MSVNDVGVAGQPATNLTAWQRSVRDALNSSDQPVDARIAANVPYVTWCYSGLTDGVGALSVTWPASLLGKRPFIQATAITNLAAVSVQVLSLTATGATLQVYRISNQTGFSAEVHITAMVPR